MHILYFYTRNIMIESHLTYEVANIQNSNLRYIGREISLALFRIQVLDFSCAIFKLHSLGLGSN